MDPDDDLGRFGNAKVYIKHPPAPDPIKDHVLRSFVCEIENRTIQNINGWPSVTVFVKGM